MAVGGRYHTMFEMQASRSNLNPARKESRSMPLPEAPLAKDMPPAMSAMWRALKRAYRAEPRLLPVAFRTVLAGGPARRAAGAVDALLADGVIHHNRNLTIAAGAGLAVSAVATWFLKVISDRTQRRFRDRVAVALESHVAGLQASVSTIDHHERPEYLDRLAMLRNQVFVLDHMYMSLSPLRVDSAARRNRGVADLHSPGAGAVSRVCAAHGIHFTWRPEWSARYKNGPPRPGAWRGICSARPPRRRREKKCASPGSEAGW